jgi:CelD/BcsL family acetyltransferase involved in cellulose biosynthesis
MGDWTISRVRLNCLARRTPFWQLPLYPEGIDARMASLDAGLAGLYLPSTPVGQDLPRLSHAGGHIRYVPAQYSRHWVEFRGSFEDYLRGFASRTRSTLKRKVRKFAELSGGAIDWRTYRSPEEMARFHELACELAAKTYQERLMGKGLPANAEYRQGMQTLAREGRTRGYLLFLQSQPVAYLYSSISEGVLLYDYLGYDPQYAAHSPGTVLQYLVLEQLFGEGGFRMFDFGQGQGAHKELFGRSCTRCADIFLLRPTLGRRLLVRTHWATDGFSQAAGKALGAIWVKRRLKKFLRRG